MDVSDFTIKMLKNRWFERFIMLLIILNSVTLAAYDYNDRNNLTSRNKIIDNITYFLNICFIIECVLKLLAKGLIRHKSSYFRDGWNIMDFIIVITAIIDLLPIQSSSSLRTIKTFRAIRPLRSINTNAHMKKLVNILLKSIPKLSNVIALLAFVITLFAIFGLHFFKGTLYF